MENDHEEPKAPLDCGVGKETPKSATVSLHPLFCHFAEFGPYLNGKWRGLTADEFVARTSDQLTVAYSVMPDGTKFPIWTRSQISSWCTMNLGASATKALKTGGFQRRETREEEVERQKRRQKNFMNKPPAKSAYVPDIDNPPMPTTTKTPGNDND